MSDGGMDPLHSLNPNVTEAEFKEKLWTVFQQLFLKIDLFFT